MKLTVLSGSGNQNPARAIAARLEVPLGSIDLQRFPNSELHLHVHESVRGHEVYLVQPNRPPAEQHIFELLFLASPASAYMAGSYVVVDDGRLLT